MDEADGLANNTQSAPAAPLDGQPTSNTDPAATLDTSAAPASSIAAAAATAREPKTIGPYQLVRKLGEGGMGQVWLAEQTAPVHRNVALKLIKVGMYDDDVLHRFQAERQSLAMMDHPAIAKVFDAGATPDGQPYFVMEYVTGVPITQYCDEKRLSVKQRLELFIKVCEGVQHAHQKAIIHRDLKPANILVTEVDGKPVPRIIDFGLAKATTPELGSETVFTRVGAFVGTPGYMSPEQADPAAHDVDTRTDVYSLGAVLYVLLTGSPPFDSSRWHKQPVHEVLRQLREEEPQSPSAKVRADSTASSDKAGLRGVQAKQLLTMLHGDLDWITMKALEKDRARRYSTPMELAADIERYLNHQPVLARPASAAYRAQKYVRRHRLGVAVISGLVLLLAGFAVMQAIQIRRITRERDRANRITNFMLHVFQVSNPSESRGNTVTARELLDKASQDIDTSLAKDPEVQAQMQQAMGDVYGDLGLYSRSAALYRRAFEIRQHALGAQNPDTLRSLDRLAWAIEGQGHYTEAERLLRQEVDTRRRTLKPNDPLLAGAMGNLGDVLIDEGHYAEAEQFLRSALDIYRQAGGPDSERALAAAGDLGRNLMEEGHYPDAEKLLRETADRERRVLGDDHPETLQSLRNLAQTLREQGRYGEAETLLRELVDAQSRVLGPYHSSTVRSKVELGGTLNGEKRYAEEAKLLRETLQGTLKTNGPEATATLLTMVNRANALIELGEYSEAEKMYRDALQIEQRVVGPENTFTASTTYNLACLAARQGKKNQALSLLSQAVDHGGSPELDLGIEADSDLASLHSDPRFVALVAHAKQVAQSKTTAAKAH